MLVQPTHVAPGSTPGHQLAPEVPATLVKPVNRRDAQATRRAAINGVNRRHTRPAQTTTATRTANPSRTNPTPTGHLRMSVGELAVAINVALSVTYPWRTNPPATVRNVTVDEISVLVQEGIDRFGLGAIQYTNQTSRSLIRETCNVPPGSTAERDILRIRRRLWGTDRREEIAIHLAWRYNRAIKPIRVWPTDEDGRFIKSPNRSGL